MTDSTIIAYQVVCTKTGTILKEYKHGQRKLARRYADKKDLQHGAICTNVRPVWSIA